MLRLLTSDHQPQHEVNEERDQSIGTVCNKFEIDFLTALSWDLTYLTAQTLPGTSYPLLASTTNFICTPETLEFTLTACSLHTAIVGPSPNPIICTAKRFSIQLPLSPLVPFYFKL